MILTTSKLAELLLGLAQSSDELDEFNIEDICAVLDKMETVIMLTDDSE